MTDLEQSIRDAIEKEMKKYPNHTSHDVAFKCGALFMVPVLMRAISDRNLQTQFHIGPEFNKEVENQIALMDQGLITLLKGEHGKD